MSKKIFTTIMSSKQIINVLLIISVIFLIGWISVSIYVETINKKVINNKVNNIINVLEHRYYSNYQKNTIEYDFPLKDNLILNDIQGKASVNEKGQITLKLYIDNYCVNKSYLDKYFTLKRTTLNKCLM